MFQGFTIALLSSGAAVVPGLVNAGDGDCSKAADIAPPVVSGAAAALRQASTPEILPAVSPGTEPASAAALPRRRPAAMPDESRPASLAPPRQPAAHDAELAPERHLIPAAGPQPEPFGRMPMIRAIGVSQVDTLPEDPEPAEAEPSAARSGQTSPRVELIQSLSPAEATGEADSHGL